MKHRKVRSISLSGLRVEAGRSGGAEASTQDIGADHEIAISVDGMPGTDHLLPPARLIIGIVAGHMGVGRQTGGDEDEIVPAGREFPPRLIGNGHLGETATGQEGKRLGGGCKGQALEVGRRHGQDPERVQFTIATVTEGGGI